LAAIENKKVQPSPATRPSGRTWIFWAV